MIKITRNQIEYLKVRNAREQLAEEIRSHRASESFRSIELNEAQRHNQEVERQSLIDLGIKDYSAASGRITAESNARNAATNEANALINQQNANTNWYNAETNRINAASNRMQAQAAQVSAAAATQQAQAAIKNAFTNEFSATSQREVNRANIGKIEADTAVSRANVGKVEAETSLKSAQTDLARADAALAEARAASERARLPELMSNSKFADWRNISSNLNTNVNTANSLLNFVNNAANMASKYINLGGTALGNQNTSNIYYGGTYGQ